MVVIVNIHDPEIKEKVPNTPRSPTIASLLQMLEARRECVIGFGKLEEEKGVLALGTSLETPRGQEMVRILMWRAVEEYAEAVNSTEVAHVKEEIIDCINYLWSIYFLEDPEVPAEQLRNRVGRLMRTFIVHHQKPPGTAYRVPDPHLLGIVTYHLAEATESFRNRAWMNNAQDVYFTGREPLWDALHTCTGFCLMSFASWEEFWFYYMAKHQVLKFRLESRY